MANKSSTRRAQARERVAIPAATKRKLLLEAGFQCSVPLCQNTHGLDLHHINGDAGDNREDKLLVLCAVHHPMASQAGTRLDKKACKLLKATIAKLAVPVTVDKGALRSLWQRATGDEPPSDRGEAFESLATTLIESIPGLSLRKAVSLNRMAR